MQDSSIHLTCVLVWLGDTDCNNTDRDTNPVSQQHSLIQFMIKCSWTPNQNTSMSLLVIPLQNCVYNSLHYYNKGFYKILGIVSGNLCSFGHSANLAFQLILKLLSKVEVRSLCRLIEFFHTKLIKPGPYGAWLCAQECSHAGTEKDLPQIPQCWQCTITLNVFVCCSINCTLHWIQL